MNHSEKISATATFNLSSRGGTGFMDPYLLSCRNRFLCQV
jgi:hypothetical protein